MWSELPVEIWFQIIDYLNCEDIGMFHLVSKFNYGLIASHPKYGLFQLCEFKKPDAKLLIGMSEKNIGYVIKTRFILEPITDELIKICCCNGYVACLDLLALKIGRENMYNAIIDSLQQMVRLNHLNVIKWFFESYFQKYNSNIYTKNIPSNQATESARSYVARINTYAAASGRTEIFDLTVNYYNILDSGALTRAIDVVAVINRIDFIEWFDKKYGLSLKHFESIKFIGKKRRNEKLLKWINENQARFDLGLMQD